MASKSTSNMIATAVVILIILNITFLIKPNREEVKNLQAEITEIDTETAKYQQEVDSLNSLGEDLPQDAVNRDKLSKAVPVGLNQSQLIDDLDSLANKHSITLYGINFGKQGDDEVKGIKKVSISASLSGAYENIVSFLNGVETNDRLMSIKSINAQKKENTENGLTNFTLYIEAYYQ